MRVAGEQGRVGPLIRRCGIEAQHGAHDVLRCALDVGERQRAVVDRGSEEPRTLLAKRHLESRPARTLPTGSRSP